MKLKTGDKVVVISGANKGKEGKITKVLDDKVIVEGVNVFKKHLKPKNNNGTGEIVEVERPIHRSNVMISILKQKNQLKSKWILIKMVKRLEFQKNLMKRLTNLEGGWTYNEPPRRKV